MGSGRLINQSVTVAFNSACMSDIFLYQDRYLTRSWQDNVAPGLYGERRSTRGDMVCGWRLASALAGTGDSGTLTAGAIGGVPLLPVEPADAGKAGKGMTPVMVDDIPDAVEVCTELSSGNDNTDRTGASIFSASIASRGATDTNTYPGASSEPTAKGRAGFPSTAISAAPWPTLLAITPDKTNLSDGPGPGPATVAGDAPISRDKVAGLDTSFKTIVRCTADHGGLPAAMTSCVQYQPVKATNAHTKTVAAGQPDEFFSLNIENQSSHSDVLARKSHDDIASSRPTKICVHQRSIHGFTLIELMVVLVIIGVLAALIVPNVLERADDARVMAARTDVNNLSQALKLYKLDNQRLPTTEQGLQALIVKPSAPPVPANWKAYLDKLPNDPWGRPYQYLNPGVKGEVDVMSLGADGQPGGESRNADVGSWQ